MKKLEGIFSAVDSSLPMNGEVVKFDTVIAATQKTLGASTEDMKRYTNVIRFYIANHETHTTQRGIGGGIMARGAKTAVAAKTVDKSIMNEIKDKINSKLDSVSDESEDVVDENAE